MWKVDELEDGREKGVGECEGEDIVDEPVFVVEVVLDENVGNDRHQHRIHQLSHNRLQSITNFSVRLGKVPLVSRHRLDPHYLTTRLPPITTFKRDIDIETPYVMIELLVDICQRVRPYTMPNEAPSNRAVTK